MDSQLASLLGRLPTGDVSLLVRRSCQSARDLAHPRLYRLLCRMESQRSHHECELRIHRHFHCLLDHHLETKMPVVLPGAAKQVGGLGR